MRQCSHIKTMHINASDPEAMGAACFFVALPFAQAGVIRGKATFSAFPMQIVFENKTEQEWALCLRQPLLCACSPFPRMLVFFFLFLCELPFCTSQLGFRLRDGCVNNCESEMNLTSVDQMNQDEAANLVLKQDKSVPLMMESQPLNCVDFTWGASETEKSEIGQDG